MSNPKVVFEAVPSRWRVENRIRDGKWVGDQCFPTLAAATIYAQKWLDDNPDGYAYRVVDTQPDAEDEHAPIVDHSCDDQARVSTFISPRFPDQIRNLWKGDPSEQSVRTALALAGDLIQELIDLREAIRGDK